MVTWLSLFCNFAVAQFESSEELTGSTTFPDVAITCLGNLAVFFNVFGQRKASCRDGCEGSSGQHYSSQTVGHSRIWSDHMSIHMGCN